MDGVSPMVLGRDITVYTIRIPRRNRFNLALQDFSRAEDRFREKVF